MGKGRGKVQWGKIQGKERTGIWCTVIKVQLFISACAELERKGNNKIYADSWYSGGCMPFVPAQCDCPTHITKIVPVSFLTAKMHFCITSQLPDSVWLGPAEINQVTQGEKFQFFADFLYLKMHYIWFKGWDVVWTNFYLLEMSLFILMKKDESLLPSLRW